MAWNQGKGWGGQWGGGGGGQWGGVGGGQWGGQQAQFAGMQKGGGKTAQSAAPAGSPPIQVSGCKNPTVSNIIKGTFSASGANHGKPVYKKDGAAGGVTVLIYFWDDRDGPSFSGWWFGPKVGGDQVWAYNANKASPVPPLAGWKVPWDGQVDTTLQLQMTKGAVQAGKILGGKPGAVPAIAPGVRPPSLYAQQHQEVAKKREEEQKKRQQELKVKRDTEDARRKEQAAALAVRKAIQRVRTASANNYDDLRAQLEEALATNLEAMGSQAEKVSSEATAALEQAQKRMDEVNEKKAAEELKKLEQEKRKKELEEQAEGFVKETKEKATITLDKTKAAEESAEKLNGGPAVDSSECDAVEKAIEEAKEEAKTTRQSIMEKQKELMETEAYRKVKREILELTSKLAAGVRSLDKFGSLVKTSREKAAKKSVALSKIAEKKKEFAKYDKDKDGKLNRKEVEAYCKAVVQFSLTKDVFDTVMKSLEPITFEKFRPMHQKLVIARSEVLARERRAEEEAKQKEIEEQKQAVRTILDAATELQATAETTATEAETKARPLVRVSDKAANAILEAADEAEVLMKKAEGELEESAKKLNEAVLECEGKEGLDNFLKNESQKIQARETKTKSRLTKVNAALKVAREKATRKVFAEIDQKRAECATAIRTKMTDENKTGEQFFEGINGGDALSKEKFATFVQELAGFEVAEGQADKLFDVIADDAGEVTKERFLELVRVFYKCVKATVMSEEISIKSKTIRRLELGEVLEALEGPSSEEQAGVQRVRCKSMADDATGWVTLAGNQGTPFLEPGGNFYSCVKETLLTDGLSVQDSKTIRRVAKGEVIEVLEFPQKDESADIKRIKGKAKLDGASGWITLSSNQGTAFLEPC